MAPLSILPGRVRFEANALIGCENKCLQIENRMISVNGIAEVSASHRTGRVLVCFNEKLIAAGDVEQRIRVLLKEIPHASDNDLTNRSPRRNHDTKANTFNTGRFFMDMAMHAFLPAPLDLILPATASIFRKQTA